MIDLQAESKVETLASLHMLPLMTSDNLPSPSIFRHSPLFILKKQSPLLLSYHP